VGLAKGEVREAARAGREWVGCGCAAWASGWAKERWRRQVLVVVMGCGGGRVESGMAGGVCWSGGWGRVRGGVGRVRAGVAGGNGAVWHLAGRLGAVRRVTRGVGINGGGSFLAGSVGAAGAVLVRIGSGGTKRGVFSGSAITRGVSGGATIRGFTSGSSAKRDFSSRVGSDGLCGSGGSAFRGGSGGVGLAAAAGGGGGGDRFCGICGCACFNSARRARTEGTAEASIPDICACGCGGLVGVGAIYRCDCGL